LSTGVPAGLPLRRFSEGVILAVRLTPKAQRDAIVGIEAYGGETVLKARVRALPSKGVPTPRWRS
jgi:uncharacterized protein YggU (UPF0235/DUF167 family)